jgi:hypothetical protein
MDGCFILQDDQAQSYSELWSYTPAGTEKKGDIVQRQDVVAFCLTAGTSTLDSTVFSEIALIYQAQQVRANKETGTGYAFISGDKVYYIVADAKVSPTHTGTIGVDYYYVGTCKKNASTADTTVLIKFDGTQWNNSDMA